MGVAEYVVSREPSSTLSTYALGSCIGLAAYDPKTHCGGLLHYMLPDSTVSPDKAARQPAMFADTGIPVLFSALKGLGATRTNLRVFVAGGASVLSGPNNFKIGERNIAAAKQLLGVYGFKISGVEIGGLVNRTLHLDLSTGKLLMKLPDSERIFNLG